MSASGPKQTWVCALHMSAFGGKADMPAQSPSGLVGVIYFGGDIGGELSQPSVRR